MCTCGEGCMLVLIPRDRPVLIAALLVCLGWHQKWHRRVANRLNTRLKCPYPVSLCLTHIMLTGLPVRLSVCTFLIEFKPLSKLPPLSGVSHSVWERMKHLGARPVPAFCDCLHDLRPCGLIRLSGALRAISLPWQHTDDVINLLQPLYIMADIFTVDGSWNGPSASHQGRDSITALVTHNSHTHTHTHTHTVYHIFTLKGRLELKDTLPLDTHCACLRRYVSFPMRTFWVFRVEECVLSWSPW